MRGQNRGWARIVSLVAMVALPCTQAWSQRAASPAPEVEEARDKGWPRQFESRDHFVRVYQPQVDEWPNFDRINLRAAVAVTPKDKDDPAYGVLMISAKTQVAFEERLVVLTDRRIEQLDFPGADPEQAQRLKQIVNDAAPPQKPQTVSLDRVLAELDPDKMNLRKVDVNLSPPKIYASERPAVMVIYLGKPRFKPVPGSDLLFATNTNWDLFMDPAAQRYYLRDGSSWLMSPDVEQGPWTPTMSLPTGLSRLPNDDNWSDVRTAIPPKPANQLTTVFVSKEPAELIVTDGAPEMQPIPGTRLMLISNTESTLFYNTADRQFYFLAAGRWFKAAELAGPWTAASTSLPEDFKKIPEDSEAADVLASVPGTHAANEAILMASIPNKATVNKSEVTVNVTYGGNPDFRVIEGTIVRYAYNSPFDVFQVNGRYYCCHNAIWFESTAPSGPWSVCTSVPAAIYTIPPTSPKYNVTYVYVYDSTPTTVTTGYTAGYTGAQVAATGAVMFGLGMLVGAALNDDDDPYWAYHYSSCFYSYGCGAHWHGAYGGYISTGRVYGPYGGAGGFAAFNPATGIYSRGAYRYGPSGAAGYRAAYNPSTGVAGYRAGATTPYGSWSRGAVTNGDDWVRGGTRSGALGSVGAIQSSEGGALARAQGRYGNGVTVGRTQEGDIYAGRDGNVYKRTSDGWQQQNSQPRALSAQPRATGSESGAVRAARPSNTNIQRPSLSSEQTQYLQQRSASRERGELNSARSLQSRSGGSRLRTGGRR